MISPRYDGISTLSLPANESWVFALLVGLFFLLILAVRMSPGLIIEEVSSVFKVKERSSIFSNLTAYNYRFRYVYVLFALCVFGLFAYSVYYDPLENDFSFLRYLYFLLAVTGWFVVKLLFLELLGYVFFDNKIIGIARRSYLSFISLLGIILFPLSVVYIYASPEIDHIIIYISLAVCGVIGILVILKLFQIFFSKLLDFFYILLYLCTLEILPVLALFQVFGMIK
ncbi:DUF4271 domain-containing protein [Paludibacteraceae bacterium OttesenSCG-928-F17]|nr:DUF4271 domain-containing protein [Paludibacteraceae bacterium OttesenSCG-928-F17]